MSGYVTIAGFVAGWAVVTWGAQRRSWGLIALGFALLFVGHAFPL